jgi:fluoride exporter
MHPALAVALGGAAGSLARFYLIVALRRLDHALPWGTLAVNVVGSFLIGVAWAWLLQRPETPEWVRVGLMTGVLGGYTTLSSVSLETVLLAQAGHPALAVLNAGGNLLLGLLACVGGLMMARVLAG